MTIFKKCQKCFHKKILSVFIVQWQLLGLKNMSRLGQKIWTESILLASGRIDVDSLKTFREKLIQVITAQTGKPFVT